MSHAKSGRAAERRRSLKEHRARTQCEARSRRSPSHLSKTRAREAALRARMPEAHQVRSLLRTTRSRAHTDAALDRGPGGKSRRQTGRAETGCEGAAREADPSTAA